MEELRAKLTQVAETLAESLRRAGTKDRAEDAERFGRAVEQTTEAIRDLAEAARADREFTT